MASTRDRVGALVLAVVTALAITVSVASTSADASYLNQGLVVSDNPVDNTPYVMDGHVNAITTVGDRVVVAGTFTAVRTVGNPVDIPRNYIFAYDRNTGVVDSGFVPALDGEVETLAAAPDGVSVFVGGAFSTVNGVSNFGLAKLNAATGQMVPGFNASAAGKIRDMEISGSKLYLGGDIWSVNGVPRSRLAAVDVNTGAVDSTFTVGTTAPRVSVDWVSEMAISPDGSEMTIVGNFAEVDNLPRAQVAVIDLSGPTAQVANWETDQFDATCSSSFWTYVRDVEYSPDSRYFVIATTGGPRPPSLCDSASRWETGDRGTGLLETWVDWSGGDTLSAVAISDVAVYIGGHQRWLNNPEGRDFAGPGAVPRPGIAALDPINGVPLSWNPGKDRGVAVWDLHLSDLGLYVGSDTDFTAGEYHAKLAQFPLTGGSEVPVPTPATLPGDLFAGQGSTLTVETFDGAAAGTPATIPGNVIDWSQVNGAFHQAGRLYWTTSTGELMSRSFDGATMGTTAVEPSWVDWSTTTSATWVDGKLYYTVSGSSELRYRYFSLESGIVGAQEFVVSGNGDGLDWTATRGLATAEGKLYYTTSSGDLYSIDMAGTVPVPGTESLISGPAVGDGRDWSAAKLFFVEVDSAPTVSLTEPVDGAVVAGEVQLVAAATDDVAVDHVDFAANGSLVGTDSDGSDGWSVAWDSTTVPDGPMGITATAFDGGLQQTTAAVSVTVDNLGPTTTLTTPVAGAAVSGVVTIDATVTDDVGVAQAEFFVDGNSIGVDTNGADGWSQDWDTTTVSDGSATVSVVGTDTFGRTSSDQATVAVSNGASGVVTVVVSDPGSVPAGDAALIARLEAHGYITSVVDDADVTAESVVGSSLVIVTSSANSYVLGSKLASATEPVWVAKPWSLDDLGLTGSVSGTDFGTLSTATMTIALPGHPLAGGFTGTVSVTTSSRTTSYGTPGAGADVVGTAGGRAILFDYPAGATLADGSIAAGCRIHHSIYGTAPLSFTSDGWALFDSVVAYAANGCTAPPVDTPPTVTITDPSDGATVAGVVTLTADAADDDAVTQVEFLAAGTSLGIDNNGTDGWSLDWDTATVGDGSVSIEAVATDTASQTGSDSVDVTVDNQGPTVIITSPGAGATLSGVVPVVADTGGDPTVTQVEFFIDGSSLGIDNNGTDGWSLDWDTTTGGDGAVTVSATATDTTNRTASDSVDVTVDNAAAGIVALVVGDSGALASVDVAIRDRLIAGGYTVRVIDDGVATVADTVGVSFVYLSSSINSTVVGDTFATAAVPVWVAKPWSLDDMGMTGTSAGTDFGTTRSDTVTIVDDTHPLASGFTGDVVVSSAPKSLSWGLPAGDASIVATSNGFATSFVYQGGALLADGSTAAACRIHVSAFQTAVLGWTADGWALFDAAATYAASGCQ